MVIALSGGKRYPTAEAEIRKWEGVRDGESEFDQSEKLDRLELSHSFDPLPRLPGNITTRTTPCDPNAINELEEASRLFSTHKYRPLVDRDEVHGAKYMAFTPREEI